MPEIIILLAPIFTIVATIGGALGVLLSIRRVYFKDDENDE